ncbi:MAG: 4Fe-4S dicluster domain-containing protein [Sedimentisphaerales bacterium]|nr:4Fe-4S dicluster domain-containing protein [Sedimentisphaerales bacterium]
MGTVFVENLKALFDAVSAERELYIPKNAGAHYVYKLYRPDEEAVFNEVRVCTPIKEFLFPIRELAAVFPQEEDQFEVKPFAVFGLKDCDLRSIEILDNVFKEDDFKDPLYISRREKMFIIASDCTEPAENCFCYLFGGKSWAEKGFDMNVSPVEGGFLVESGSDTGNDFLAKAHFAQVQPGQIAQRDENRKKADQILAENNAKFKLDRPVQEIVEGADGEQLYTAQAEGCVECQACTRVCPTCHCFYLQDTKLKDYYGKMKMWDSCMRMSYAAVAGGENPRKAISERIKHRLLHKFSYYLQRYGINMCVGCGRCIDAESGKMDLRRLLRELNDEVNRK